MRACQGLILCPVHCPFTIQDLLLMTSVLASLLSSYCLSSQGSVFDLALLWKTAFFIEYQGWERAWSTLVAARSRLGSWSQHQAFPWANIWMTPWAPALSRLIRLWVCFSTWLFPLDRWGGSQGLRDTWRNSSSKCLWILLILLLRCPHCLH